MVDLDKINLAKFKKNIYIMYGNWCIGTLEERKGKLKLRLSPGIEHVDIATTKKYRRIKLIKDCYNSRKANQYK